MKPISSTSLVLTLALIVGLAGCDSGKSGSGSQKSVEIMNVSYDPTRELWKQINEAFIPDYEKKHGTQLSVVQSHGGSGSQARAVIDGLEADVVTLAMWADTDAIRQAGLIKEGWQDRLPNGALPYSSTIVFVVRKGNPKQIADWPDLVREGVQVITPNPKTSANGKLSFLAAWGSAVLKGKSDEEAQAFVAELYRHVPVLDTGARGATTTFAQKKIGDVHLTWENEAHLEVKEAEGELEIVVPSLSIRAEPRVAIVDATVDRKKTREVAEAYLQFLYTPEGQEIIAKNYYRPYKSEVLHKYADSFKPVEQFPIQKLASGWDEAEKKFFSEGGVYDQIVEANSKK